MEKEFNKLPRWLGFALSAILVPLIIGVITNFSTWFATKDKVEVTFRLDGWITIGSVTFSDLPQLKLMFGAQEVESILKVSWRVINSGNKGIPIFENGPFIEFPESVNIVTAKISETSPLLKISKKVSIKNNVASIDSLGIFNPNDFFRVDFYLQNIAEKNITGRYFERWNLSGKSIDLSILKDISSAAKQASDDIRSEKDRTLLGWVSRNEGMISLLSMIIPLMSLLMSSVWVYYRYRTMLRVPGVRKRKKFLDE